MKAIYIEQTGGPDVLQYGDRPKPEPAKGEVLVKLAASGVNFVDTYHRSGLSKVALPSILGSEGAGIVEQVGADITNFKAGDRVAYAMVRGSYAEYASVPEKMLVHVPASTELRTAAAAMLQGMTAHYLTHSTFPLKPGNTVLIHAAAGGTGRLIVQVAAMLGARVIGTVGNEAKAALARAAGASDTILYDQQDWVAEVKRLTGGAGVDVVYDTVGQATFLKGLDCIRPRGMMVAFGRASGQLAPLDTQVLAAKGSLVLSRPGLAWHIATPEELAWRAGDVFRWVSEGKLELRIDHEYPLAEAAQAHRDLEARKTTGKIILRV